ncbi:unnamed protein product [Porites lobata]|uniref:DUF1985 domain-containing protein n=1 Tax=Porites lobata TaxID=104759 RepID=A0ABN8SG27_9CNID|nr:unnamed protein product [Porites lobata]
MWHTKASLLQYTYSFLHKAESVNQIGTLKYFREKYNRRNATPSKVLDSYEGSEELFLSVGKAYIITAVLNFFGMSDLEDTPSLHKFPQNIARETTENKKKYFDDAFGKFIDKFLLQKVNANDFYNDDYVMNYALCCIFLAVLVMQMKDTAAEGDGNRNLINQKLLLSCLLTPRLSEQFKWGFFVNWRGGFGRNIKTIWPKKFQTDAVKVLSRGRDQTKL